MLMTALVAAAVIGGMAVPPNQSAQPVIAITVDDLPMHGPYPAGESPVSAARGVAAALKAERVEATAFINGEWTEKEPSTAEALEIWRDAGLPLGNHGWAHRHLSEMSAAEFEQELVKNEPLLRRFSPTRDWKWFRYPFLDEGENADKRAAAREVLARRGYRVAAVAMDFTDWAWTAPYARCRDSGNKAAVARLEQLFLQSSRENIAYYRQLSRTVYGREIPYVLILHVSAFEARVLPRLLRLLRDEGFRFTTLGQAQTDPAYADQNDPRLPAKRQGLDGKASEKGPLPPKTDYQAILAGMCPSAR
jgi:peptidoglycan/xylan/chitin deacetylase (PgdA/CDA1 family)